MSKKKNGKAEEVIHRQVCEELVKQVGLGRLLEVLSQAEVKIIRDLDALVHRGGVEMGAKRNYQGRIGRLYRIISPCGRSYIGFTTRSLAHRLRDHGYNAKRIKGPLPDAIRQHGIAQFQIELLAELPWHDLLQAEQDAIIKYDTLWPKGLNASEGGNGGSRLIPNSEALRVKKMKATMATKAYKKDQRAKQIKAWTPEKRIARAEAIRKMWEDPEYRARQMVSRVRPRKPQKSFRLARDTGEHMRRLWAKPEWREAARARQTAYTADPAVRAKMAETQRRVMQTRPELREQIALTQIKYKDQLFRKLVDLPKARKQGVITRSWSELPPVVSGLELWKAGWRTTEIYRAMERNWLTFHNDVEVSHDQKS